MRNMISTNSEMMRAKITLKTGDPVKGWEAGLTWVFIQSFVLMIGGFAAPYIRRIAPRAALLANAAPARPGTHLAAVQRMPRRRTRCTPP
mgnify:CR=1 FL=1